MADDGTFADLMQQFPYVYAWGKALGSDEWYIHNQMLRAARAYAPKNSVYWKVDGEKWITYDQVTNTHTRLVVDRIIARLKGDTNG